MATGCVAQTTAVSRMAVCREQCFYDYYGDDYYFYYFYECYDCHDCHDDDDDYYYYYYY